MEFGEAHRTYFGLITMAFGAVTPVVICVTKLPALLSSATLLPVEFATHRSPPASKASDDGALRLPLPVNGDPLNTPPLLVNAETLVPPLFATHAFPLASMAMAAGELSPLLENGEPVIVAPVCFNTVTVLLPEFAIHTLPFASIVVDFGELNPLGA